MVFYGSAGSVFGGTIDPSELEPQAGEGALVYDATGAPAFLAPSGAKQVLRENAGGTALEFAAPEGWTVLADDTLGSAATTQTVSVTTTGYELIKIFYFGSTTDTNTILLQPNADSGANYTGGFIRDNASAISHLSNPATSVYAIVDPVADSLDGFAEITIIHPASTSTEKRILVHGNNGQGKTNVGGATWNDAANAISSLKFLVNGGGNLNTGNRCIVLGYNSS